MRRVLVASVLLVASPLRADPSLRNQPGVAFDEGRKRLVLFGGWAEKSGVLGDTWEWDGARWSQAAAGGPAARGSHAVAYDRHRRVVMLFGGQTLRRVGDKDETVNLADTWEWNGKRWRRLADGGPPPRSSHQLAYDERRRRMVLFGGLDAQLRPLGDTWEWDGRRWRPVEGPGPAPRFHHVMVADAARGDILLFGGHDGVGKGTRSLGDTWRFDGATWRQVEVAGPPARDHQAMAYDAARRRVVMFGGWSPETNFLGDTWEWDGSTWSRIDVAGPSERGGKPGMAYDAGARRIVLYGGWGKAGPLADLWTWDGAAWRQVGAP